MSVYVTLDSCSYRKHSLLVAGEYCTHNNSIITYIQGLSSIFHVLFLSKACYHYMHVINTSEVESRIIFSSPSMQQYNNWIKNRSFNLITGHLKHNCSYGGVFFKAFIYYVCKVSKFLILECFKRESLC